MQVEMDWLCEGLLGHKLLKLDAQLGTTSATQSCLVRQSLSLPRHPATSSHPGDFFFNKVKHESKTVQVEVDGEWVSIPPEPGHLIVNLGDLLHR